MKFKTELTDKGKQIFKGGNLYPMSIGLIKFEADNMRKAEAHFYKHLCETVGSSQADYYKTVED